MQRLLTVLVTTLALSGAFLVIPVYAEDAPEAVPVETSAEEVPLGSIDAPAPEADVQAGTTEGVDGVAASTPVLTVRETDVREFSLVGVSWAYDPAVTDTVVQVRVRQNGGTWGEWTEVGTEDAGPGPGAVATDERRGATEPLWTGPSTGVDVELVTRSGAQPTDVRLSLIDPGESEADSSPETPEIRDTANAATAVPPVYSRAQWGADERLMTWRPEYASTIKAATVHHTAGSNGYSATDVPRIMRGIYHYHAVTNGWGDIGYNALVDKFGRIWEGRAGGLARPVVGAHAGAFNVFTFGVSMIGNYDVVATTQPMLDSVAAIVAWKLSLHQVPSNGTTRLTAGARLDGSIGSGTDKYGSGVVATLPTIFAHRDSKSTACPGRYGYAKMPYIRARAASLMDHSHFVRALYDDLLTRPADEGGLRTWTTALASGRDRQYVFRQFTASPEYHSLVVRQGYQRALGRPADPEGLATWTRAIARGWRHPDAIVPALMESAEFVQRGGGGDAAFVGNLYQVALGRAAAPSEIASWGLVRSLIGSKAVVQSVWSSAESAKLRVDRGYQYWLGRPAAPSEQEFWRPFVQRNGDERFIGQLAASAEYGARAAGRYP